MVLRAGERMFATGAVLVWASLAAGCGLFSSGGDAGTVSLFRDVIFPVGLRVVDDAHQSYAEETAGGYRNAHYLCVGTAPREAAIEQVRQQAPRHSWELVADESLDPNTHRLLFRRGHYSLEYRFLRNDGRLQVLIDYKSYNKV